MISVVIPVYNVEKYIIQCLNSLENQTYKNFEVICVDDGSTDQSGEMICDFGKTSKLNLRYYKTENHGVSRARNFGIEQAKGEYLCFVDSDDMVYPRYLEFMMKNILDYDADVTICQAKDIKHTVTVLEPHEDNEVELFNNLDILNQLLLKKIKIGIWGIMVRHDILGGLKFAEGYAYSEDLEFVWRVIAKSKRITMTSCQLYAYRVTPGSAMSKKTDKRMDGMKLFMGLEPFLKKEVPEFYPKYEKWGVGRWVWATLWQDAAFSDSYRDFRDGIVQYEPVKYMKKVLTFPEFRIRVSSAVFLCSKPLYYHLVKFKTRNYRKDS